MSYNIHNLQNLSNEYEIDFKLIPIFNRLISIKEWDKYWKYIKQNLSYEQYKHYIMCYDNGIDIKYIMNKNQEKNFSNWFCNY